MHGPQIALKVDVDTHQGLASGVPRLARMLEAEGVAASFFIAMGPDNSGRAVMRLLRNPGFLEKMRRTKAVQMYGWRTVLSGTLLPARAIALALPSSVRALRSAGFEVGVHGWDHVRWQDEIDALGEEEIRVELSEAFEAYRAIFREDAMSFAAPGWRISPLALKILDSLELSYHSNTRGRTPFRCRVDGEILNTPEIPTTLPTLDEVMGRADLPDAERVLEFYLAQFAADRLNVHTVHAETEGMSQLENFGKLIRALKDRGARFLRMDAVAATLRASELPVCEVVRETLLGRSGWISAQAA
jgi:undecaprenyl phosphate-alpha-L-ara4FN deformylase